MALQPNRPIRVGTEMMTTDAKGNIPQRSKSTAAPTAPDTIDEDAAKVDALDHDGDGRKGGSRKGARK